MRDDPAVLQGATRPCAPRSRAARRICPVVRPIATRVDTWVCRRLIGLTVGGRWSSLPPDAPTGRFDGILSQSLITARHRQRSAPDFATPDRDRLLGWSSRARQAQRPGARGQLASRARSACQTDGVGSITNIGKHRILVGPPRSHDRLMSYAPIARRRWSFSPSSRSEMCRRGDQTVLNDTDASTAVDASAETPDESLKESCFTPPDLGHSQYKNLVVAALVAALVVASVVGLESACGSVARLQVPASCDLRLSTVPTSDFYSVQKTINDYMAGVF